MTLVVRVRALTLPVLVCLLWPTLVAAQLVTGAGPGSNAVVRVIETNGTDRSFLAYPEGFVGGVTVAFGDITGDGVADIVTGAGPGGGPHVRVWDGVTLLEVGGFFAYPPGFPGGVSVATGDVNGDGRADIITGAGPGGGPHVRVWSGTDFTEIGGFFAYDPAFPGGVAVAAGDVNGDGRADIITGPGPGGGPHVRVWSGTDFTEIGGFFAYDPAFPGGVHVAAGDVNGDGLADIITGAGPGGGPHVRVWSGAGFTELGGFFAYDPAFTGGVVVGGVDLTGDGRVEIITAPGPGAGPLVAIWNGADFALLGAYFAFDPAFTGGVSVGSPGGSNALRFTSATTTTFGVTTPGTFTVTTAGGAAVPTLTVTGALPTGVTFTDNGDRTATLAGTPAAGTGGSHPLTFTATSGSAPPVTQAFTLTVAQAPAITSPAATTFGLGGPGTFTVTTTGVPTPTLSSTGALPAGVTFTDNGTGTATLAGTPAPGSGGTYPLTITATNGVSPDAVQAFVLTVNASPAFTSANATTFPVGTPGTFAITTIATPPVTSIVRTGAALPSGVTFVDNGTGTATLSGTPAVGTGGSYVFTLTASNGVGTNAVQTFTLTVTEAPVFTSATSDTFVVGTADSFTVTTTGFPTPTVTHTSGALPTGISFTSGTRVLGGTATQTGAFGLEFTAANGVGANTVQNFTLTVVCPAITVTALALPDGLYQIAYGAVDFNQAGSTGSSFNWGATGLPAGITIDATTGVVSGTPTNTQVSTAVVITVTDNFGCQASHSTALIVRPTTDNENYVGGVGHTQYVVSAAVPSTPHVFVLDNVKNGDTGPGALTVVFGPATNGTVAEGSADGTFTYTPNLNFAGPTDTFTYTLTDGNGVTNTGTVTMNLSGLVWYVNGSGGNGDGRSHAPFNSVTNAQAPSGDGQVIYVHTGGATTPGTITLKPTQTLWGAGATFTLNSLTIPFTGQPTLAGTVTLANGVLVNSLNVNGGASPAITGTGVGGTVAINSVGVLGGSSGIDLTNLGGTLTFQFSAVSGVTPGASLRLSGGTATVSGRLGITSTVGRSVDIQGKTAGTVTLGGAIVDTGLGIFLNGNTNATIDFTGGMALNTLANPAFTATGGGTISVTQNNTTVVNTLTTTTGTALNVASTTIGASGLTFRSITSSGGGSVAIELNNTGTIGGLNVAGNGIAGTTAGEGTGGTISNKTGDAIVLNDTAHVRLNDMIIGATAALAGEGQPNVTNNIGGDAIRITLVRPIAGSNYGLTLDNVTISQTGGDGIDGLGAGNVGLKIAASRFLNIGDDLAGVTESAINFGTGFPSTDQITGTVHIDDSTFAGFTGYGFTVENAGNGTLNMTVEDSVFKNNDGTTVGNSGIQLILDGSSSANNPKLMLLVEDTAFTNLDLDGVEVTTDPGATSSVTIRRTTYSNPNGDNAIHMVSGSVDADDVEAMTVWIEDTTITSQRGTLIFLKAGAGTYDATVTSTPGFTGTLDSGLSIDGAGGHIGRAIEVLFDADNLETISARVLIENQTLRNIGVDGIHIASNETIAGTTIDATFRNNIIGEVGAEIGRQGTGEGIEVKTGSSGASAGTMNVLVDNNTIRMRNPAAANPGMEGIDLDAEASSTLNATITANTLSNPVNTGPNIEATSETAAATLNLDIRGNTSTLGTDPDYELIQLAGIFRVEGPGTGAVTTASIEAAQVSGTAAVTGTLLFNNSVNVTLPGPPSVPPLPPVPPGA